MSLHVVPPPPEDDDPGSFPDGALPARSRIGPHLRSGSDQEVASEFIRYLTASSGAQPVYDEGKLWRYDGGIWVPQPDEESRNVVCSWDGSPFVGVDGKPRVRKDGAPSTYTANQRSAKAALERTYDLASQPGFFDSAETGVMFRDAFVRVTKKGEVLRVEPSPDCRARFRIDADYPTNEFAVPADYIETMFRAFADDEDKEALAKIELVREWFGTALIGEPTYSRALMLVGPERSGKSVTAKIGLGVFPPEVRAAISIKSLDPSGAAGSSAQYYLAQLAGVRINADLDLPGGTFVGGENFKKIATGEGLMGRHPAGRPFAFTPRAAMLFAGESLPTPEDKNRGFFRRWLVVRYRRQVNPLEVVENYEAKVLEKERGLIAAWFIRGAANAIKRGGFDIPQSVADEIPRWVLDADPAAQFCEQFCVAAPNMPREKWNTTAYFHGKYAEWCKSSGYYPKAINTFGRDLRRNFSAELGYEDRTRTMRWGYRYESSPSDHT